MKITKGDLSILRRNQRDLPTLVIEPGHVLRAKVRIRDRQMFLHGTITTEDGRVVNLSTDEYMMPIYCLYLEESKNGEVIHKGELWCGLSGHDPDNCWQIIRKYNTLPFNDIEAIMEEHGYPNNTLLGKKYKSGLGNYARYNNVIKRNNYEVSIIELIEVHEVDPRKK